VFYAGMSVGISSRAKGHASFDSSFNNLFRNLVHSSPGFFLGFNQGCLTLWVI